MELSGGNRRYRRRFHVGIATTVAATVVLAFALTACGGGSSSSADEESGTYRVKVVDAEFPAEQRLGETTLMQLGIRNSGDKTIPALTVTVSIAGKEGQDSTLPFGFRDPSPGLAQPDRPIWVLSEHYPKLAGSSEPGGTEIAARKTFVFGPLASGETRDAVWKLSAVKTGRYHVLYRVGAGLGGKGKAEAASGVPAGGSFGVEITEVTPEVTVNDNGEVVEVEEPSGATK